MSTPGMGTQQNLPNSECILKNSLMLYSSSLMSYHRDSIDFYLSTSMSICLASYSLLNCSLSYPF
jgi:hypothetical protein